MPKRPEKEREEKKSGSSKCSRASAASATDSKEPGYHEVGVSRVGTKLRVHRMDSAKSEIQGLSVFEVDGIMDVVDGHPKNIVVSGRTTPFERVSGGSGSDSKKPIITSGALRTRDNPRSHHLELRNDFVANSLTKVAKDSIVVSGQTTSTNTPPKSTAKTTATRNSSKVTLEKWMSETSQITTSSPQDSHAKLLALLESGVDLKTREGLSSLRSLGYSRKKDPDIFYSKTSKVCLVTNMAKLSRRYLGFSPTSGIYCNGKYSIVSTSVSPRTGSGSSLSDILQEPGEVDPKYFLSQQMVKRLAKNLEKSGTSPKPDTIPSGEESTTQEDSR